MYDHSVSRETFCFIIYDVVHRHIQAGILDALDRAGASIGRSAFPCVPDDELGLILLKGI